MPKKTTETKLENQTAKKQPTELKDEQLDKVQGGVAVQTSGPFRDTSEGRIRARAGGDGVQVTAFDVN